MSFKDEITERLTYISTMNQPDETEMMKCSFNLPKSLVYQIDYLANELKTSRQDFVLSALVNPVREAMEAYGEFYGYTSGEFIDIQGRISEGIENPYHGSKKHERTIKEAEKAVQKNKGDKIK